MVHIPNWKKIFIAIVCTLALLYSAPNVIGSSAQQWATQNLPGWMPNKTVNLGLDLQGGAHLLLGVEVDVVVKERLDDLRRTARTDLRKAQIDLKASPSLVGEGLRVRLKEASDVDAAKKILREIDRDFLIDVTDNTVLDVALSDQALQDIRDRTIEQSIEIVRRRIDESGTKEPVIQRQGDDRILLQLPGIDNPDEIKALLGKTAKLTFHLVDMDVSSSLRSGGGRNLVVPMADDPAQTMALERRVRLSGDMLVSAAYQPDENGRPAISFRFNGVGAKKFCDLSREHVNRLFAIVLDNEIISAPVIREPICGGQGQISGSFTLQEATNLALLLRAGALPAPLEILEERTVGPSLGADSVEAGKKASAIGLALVLIFMGIMYGLFGLFANVALVINMALIFALLSSLQATLTLPGIAGIVLTIGMAVDANVLIFERIREEIRNGRSPIAAIDTGYSRAMGTIIDSNLTTLIAAIILFSFGTGPIKGFAVTLGIGIVTSFFSAIMVTRLLVVVWLRGKKPATLPV